MDIIDILTEAFLRGVSGVFRGTPGRNSAENWKTYLRDAIVYGLFLLAIIACLAWVVYYYFLRAL